jgi:hypothetical protein
MRTLLALLFTAALIVPSAAQDDDWYRVGPGAPYGYGLTGPGSYSNAVGDAEMQRQFEDRLDFDYMRATSVHHPHPAVEHLEPQPAPPAEPPAVVEQPVAPQGPPPDGWVFAPYTTCVKPNPQCTVYVPADGLNIRQTPNGQPIVSLVNGTPLHVYGSADHWLLVKVECNLVPLWAWSITANVPLMICG